MKTMLSKIYIHPLTLISILIFILMGRFRLLFYFMLLIIAHEIGHIISSIFFKWKIDKIVILPFGGLIKYKNLINTKIKEDFLVAISGIVYQSFFYILINNYIKYDFFSYIHYFIIIFNLIPIYPLDGSKILNSIFNLIFSFYKSMKITTYLSFLLLLILTIISIFYNKLLLLIIIFLLNSTYKFNKNIELIFNKFLLERYTYNFKFKRIKIISNEKQIKKDYTHIFFINNKYLLERNYLNNRYI